MSSEDYASIPVPLSEMPDENSKLALISVDFPELPPHHAECPVAIRELLSYLADEAPGGERLQPDDLHFLRTAQVAEQRYWVWRFNEPDTGDPAYATVAVLPDRTSILSYGDNNYGLTPEQHLLGVYHNVF